MRATAFLLVLSAVICGAGALAADWPPAVARGDTAAGSGSQQAVSAWRGPAWQQPAWQWRRLPVSGVGDGGALLAVAVDPLRPGRAAVGHAGGVSLRGEGGGFRFAARVAGVTDLAFAPDGSLWIASLGGLWQLTREGRLVDRSPAPGDEARRVRRVSIGPAGVAAATAAGAWVASLRSGGDIAWTRLADGLPRGPVLAARPAAGGRGEATRSRLYVLVGRELWLVTLGAREGRLELETAERVAVPGAPTGEVALDLFTGPGRDGTGEVVLLYARSLAVREAGGRFRLLRPVLPPGATATRLAGGAGRVWLATDQGLMRAPGWSGPWRRAEAPAGNTGVLALAEAGARDELLAASPSGLLRGVPVLLALEARAAPQPIEGLAESAADSAAASLPPDPDIRRVQAASLRYLGLETRRMRELREGLAVRGWIPQLSLRLAAARDKSWGTDDDQAYVSGETRFLRDRDEGKNLDLEASLVMTWDLGALAFDDDAVDLSREHRQVVSLRDNVLDEINQIYFERRGLLAKLRQPANDADPERERMALRAAELAAGLDAWTGGWFSSLEAHRSPGPDSLEELP